MTAPPTRRSFLQTGIGLSGVAVAAISMALPAGLYLAAFSSRFTST